MRIVNIHISARHPAIVASACLALLVSQPVIAASATAATNTAGSPAATPSAAQSTPPAFERPAAAMLLAQAQQPKPAKLLPLQLSSEPARIGSQMNLVVGKSTLLRLPDAVARLSVGNPAIADATPISEREVYFLGKDLGTTNLIIWARNGQATVIDITVSADPTLLERELLTLLPEEKDIRVTMTADSIVLLGTVSDPVKAAQAEDIAQAWIRRLTRGIVLPIATGGATPGSTTVQVSETRNSPQQLARVTAPRVINMLKVLAPMQVMLEVKVAEVSKNLLSKIGVSTRLNQQSSGGNVTSAILSQSSFFNQLLGVASVVNSSGDSIQLDAQRDDGLVKLLAEPNIMAISGQEASFRAGGKIFIPVSRRNDTTGGSTIELEEKEFGVGLKFKPTVLEGGRINLHVIPEVSELQQSGSPFLTIDGVTSVLPSFILRRAETTVQLHDGQSFMIAGMIQDTTAATIKRFPGLGDIPILGALFRSTEFQSDKTELMFVITPRLVKPLPANYALPTDRQVDPSTGDLLLHGRLEGEPRSPTGGARPGDASGFQMK
jgi:pilus assembly protein CpaC